MHPQQKHARFNLIVISCAVVPAALGYAVLLTLYGPKVAMAASGFFGICGLLGFGGKFYSKGKDSPKVTMDERDEDIKRRAMLIGWGVDWLFWGLLCMIPWFVVAFRDGLERLQEPMVPVAWLPLAYGATALLHVSAWSIAVLVLYGKGAGGDEA
jgi:hypothetical protein